MDKRKEEDNIFIMGGLMLQYDVLEVKLDSTKAAQFGKESGLKRNKKKIILKKLCRNIS